MRRVVLGTSAWRGGLALLGALIALGLAQPAPADAGFVLANVNVKGAGFITGSAGCDGTSNVDERVLRFCTVAAQNIPGGVAVVTLIANPSPTPTGHWSFVEWQGCESTGGTVCVIQAAGFETDQRTVTAVFNDDTGPAVTPGPPSHSTTVDRAVTWPALGANEPATFECSLDGGGFSACTTGTPITASEGVHSVRFRGTDASGNVGNPTAPQNFTIIDTSLVSGPPDFSPSNDVSFVLSTVAGLSFDCSFDAEPFADCGNAVGDQLTVSRNDLPDGAHTFRARARFGASDFDRVPLVRTWEVDTVAPDTGFDPAIGPRDGDVTTLFGATFAISANEPASLQCRLGSADFAGCSSPHSFADLPFGQHRFEARAVDRAGNVDASPAGRTWTIVAVDIDGDGFNQRSDCNENDPRINPSAREIRGNAVDENCDRVAAETTRMRVTLSHAFKAFARYTTFSKFQVRGLPSRATVRVACKVGKKKCPAKARKSLSKRNASGNLNLKSRYVGIRLKPKTTITVTVTAPEFQRFIKTIKVRAGKIPLITDRCVPQGASRPQRCR